MITRIVLTVIILFIAGWASGIVNPVAMIGAGQVAGLQMQSSDPAAIASFVGMRFFSSLGSWVVGVTFLVLLAVWFGRQVGRERLLRLGLIAATGFVLTATPYVIAYSKAPASLTEHQREALLI